MGIKYILKSKIYMIQLDYAIYFFFISAVYKDFLIVQLVWDFIWVGSSRPIFFYTFLFFKKWWGLCVNMVAMYSILLKIFELISILNLEDDLYIVLFLICKIVGVRRKITSNLKGPNHVILFGKIFLDDNHDY